MSSTNVSVLWVESDPYLRETFRLVLDYHNIPNHVSRDAESALAYLRNQRVSIVVLEHHLATVNDDQLLRELKALAPEAKFVVTSARHPSERSETIRRHGFDGFIPKPFAVSDLVPYLQKIVTSQRPEDIADFWDSK